MPLDHVLFQPFANHWEAGNQTFEWTTRGDDLFLRPHGAPLSQVWALLNAAAYGPQLSLPRTRCEPFLPVSVKTRHALQGRLLWRFWPLSPGESCLLRARGSLLRADGLPTVRFAHAAFPDFDRANESELAQWHAAVEAPDSDLHIARRWQRFSETERINEIVATRGSTWDELLELIDAAFVLWAQTGDKLELDLTQAGPISVQRLSWGHSESIEATLKFLAEHWSLHRVAPHDLTRWWRGCDAFGDPMDAPQPKFVAGYPSQHERLEALLLWRNWLRDKLSPEQIESLLAGVL